MVISFALAASVFANADSGAFAPKLPAFSLQDPAGKTFTSADFSQNGLVLVVTAPILKNKSAQERWHQYLLKAKAGSKAPLVYLEDLQPSLFKGKAMKRMKQDYASGKEPILLIDPDGAVRRALQAPPKKTLVLVYDRKGKLIYSDMNAASAEAARVIWQKLNLAD